MTNTEIISKLAEAVYLERIRREPTYGDADSDWTYASRAFKFFEEKEPSRNPFYEEDKKDLAWLYPLYNLLKEKQGGTYKDNRR